MNLEELKGKELHYSINGEVMSVEIPKDSEFEYLDEDGDSLEVKEVIITDENLINSDKEIYSTFSVNLNEEGVWIAGELDRKTGEIIENSLRLGGPWDWFPIIELSF